MQQTFETGFCSGKKQQPVSTQLLFSKPLKKIKICLLFYTVHVGAFSLTYCSNVFKFTLFIPHDATDGLLSGSQMLLNKILPLSLIMVISSPQLAQLKSLFATIKLLFWSIIFHSSSLAVSLTAFIKVSASAATSMTLNLKRLF